MIGKTLAHYEILEKIGVGGMGEVYRARDPQLDREVAIKILPDAAAGDPERMARFELEAKTLAAVNHPEIATVFGLHEQDGTRFMAMELVPGSDLSQRISKGAIPTRDALGLALQIAEALEAAHQQGIIHRDLKPQNLMITPEGKIKVLDFGLARMLSRGPIRADDDPSPTITAALTQPGTILGTPAYMSPEQVQGAEIDARSDIWSFGALLYEMLTGVRAFAAKTIPETMYLVSQRDPDLNLLPAPTPAKVRRLVRRCLVKEVRNRLQSIGDARVILQEAIEGRPLAAESATSQPRPWRNLALWLLLPLAAVAIWFLKPQGHTASLEGSRFEVFPPEGLRVVTKYQHGLAFSPDGQILAFVAGTAGDPLDVDDTETAIYLRHLDQWESRMIPGTEGASQPFFSPDGDWLGFDQDHKLKKVRLSGGDIQTVFDGHAHFGASWGPDGTIVFGQHGFLGIVPAVGGVLDTLTVRVPGTEERYLRLPHFLPSGRAVLFTSMDLANSMDYEENVRIKVVSLETGEVKTLIRGGTDARFVGNGHLVFAKEGALYAVSFDPVKLQLQGEEFPVLEGVSHSIHAGQVRREIGAAQFTISESGALAYLAGSVFPKRIRSVVWIDREGREEPLDLDPKQYLSSMLSKDGSEVLLPTNYTPYDVWSFDLERKVLRRQTFEGTNHHAIWGPGPGQFTVSSSRNGSLHIITKQLDSGPGTVQSIPGSDRQWACDWDPSGRLLLTHDWSNDIWSFTPEGPAGPILQTSFSERNPSLSPDGRWLLYTSNESGQNDVYVRSFPVTGPRVQVSVDGGHGPGWALDGHEIHYWAGDYKTMMVVPFRAEGEKIEVGTPRTLFVTEPLLMSAQTNYSVAPDGRFLIVKVPTDSLMTAIGDEVFPDRIRVVTEWVAALEEKFRSQ